MFKINGIGSATPFDLRRMTICETVDGTEAAVRDMRPCFAGGKAALYDTVNEKVYYPTSDGFTLSGYDISVGNEKTLAVNASSCSPHALKLGAGCELIFDGTHVLQSDSEVKLPETGTIRVSQTAATGKGRYTLIDNLPEDFDLATFVLGDVPLGFSGELSKDGDRLILTLSSSTESSPDAMAEFLSSDGVGHVDLEYTYKAGVTSSVTCDLHIVKRGMGDIEVPIPSTGPTLNRGIFGFWISAAHISAFRFNGRGSVSSDDLQCWGTNWDYVTTKSYNEVEDLLLAIDYSVGKFAWDGTTFSGEIPVPATDCESSYWVFSVNGNDYPTPFDLRRMTICETVDGTEVAALDVRPCMVDGKAALYDTVNDNVYYPTTDGFTASNLTYRLSVNGETNYVDGAVSVPAADPSGVEGWFAVSDLDGRIVARGDGTVAEFEMPAEPVTIGWMTDSSVAADGTMEVTSYVITGSLALGADSTLAFAGSGASVIASELILPETGSVNVIFAGENASGSHVLVNGVTNDVDLSGLKVASVPTGCNGALSRIGDAIVLTLTRDPSAGSAIVADVLKGDGTGYVDTGYFYTYNDEVKTSKVTAEFNSVNRGMGDNEIGISKINRSLFGYLSKTDENISYVRFFGNGKATSDQIQMWGYDYKDKSVTVSGLTGRMLGHLTFYIDYLNEKGSFYGGDSLFDLPAFAATSPKSYWILNVNGNNAPTPIDFLKMDVYEERSGTEVLAHRYVPALNGEDKAALYDTVTGAVLMPTGSDLSVDFGTVAQEFFTIATVSEGMPVSVPAFGIERDFTFYRDGSVKAKLVLSSVTVTRYDAAGGVLSSEETASVAAGDVLSVALDGAAKAVVTVAGATYPEEKTVTQLFGPVETLSVAPVSFRRTQKYEYELALAGDTELTFGDNVDEVWVDDYAADGTLAYSTRLAGRVMPGGTLSVSGSECAWRVIRVSESRPGTVMVLR